MNFGSLLRGCLPEPGIKMLCLNTMLFYQKYPESSLIQNVRWRIYECHEKLGNDNQVLQALNDYIINEKDLVKERRARMNKARLLFDQDDLNGALNIYEAIDRKVDEGKLWESASYESARIYLQQSKQGEAFLRFRQLASLKYNGLNQDPGRMQFLPMLLY